MKSQRAAEIAAQATELVDFFGQGTKKSPQLLLPRNGERIHAELRDFADHVVLLLHLNDWGNHNYLQKHVAVTLSLFQAVDIIGLPGGHGKNLGGYASWLYMVFPGVYATVFDGACISRRFARQDRTLDEIYVRLYLHELGHLVLHRDNLFRGLNNGLAISAQAVDEEEAWFFASCVMGLAVGARAREAKQRSYLDDSWTDSLI
jgi:hypothetical protein